MGQFIHDEIVTLGLGAIYKGIVAGLADVATEDATTVVGRKGVTKNLR